MPFVIFEFELFVIVIEYFNIPSDQIFLLANLDIESGELGTSTEIILDVMVVSKLLILPVTKKLFKTVFINLHIIKYAYIKKDIIIDTLFCCIIFFLC